MTQPRRDLPPRGRPPSPIGSCCIPSDIPGSKWPTLPCSQDSLVWKIRRNSLPTISAGYVLFGALGTCLIARCRGQALRQRWAAFLRRRASVPGVCVRTWEDKIFLSRVQPRRAKPLRIKREHGRWLFAPVLGQRSRPRLVCLAGLSRGPVSGTKLVEVAGLGSSSGAPRASEACSRKLVVWWCLVGGLHHRTGLVEGDCRGNFAYVSCRCR